MNNKVFIAVFSLSLALSISAQAQFLDFPQPMPIELHQPLDNQTRTEMRNANMMESRGDFEAALNIYLDVFAKYPEYSPFYDGTVRCFVAAGKFYEGLSWTDSLKKALLSHGTAGNLTASEREKYANLIVDGGRFCTRLGKRDDAFSRWDELYSLTNVSANPYYRLFSAMIEARAPDKLEEMVKRARQVTHDPTLLTSALAEFWAQQGQVGRATEEYLSLMELQPRMADGIRSRILSLPEDQEAIKQVELSLKGALSRKTIKLQVTQLLSAFYFRERQWEQAYEQILLVDQSGDKSGLPILEFTEKLNSEREYKFAIKAIDDLTKTHPNLAANPRLWLAEAVALEGNLQYLTADSVYSLLTTPTNLRGALGQEALIHQADLRLNLLRQPQSARALLEDGFKQQPNLFKGFEATLLIGDTYLAQRNYPQAKAKYLEAAGGRFGSDPAKRSKALINAAQIDFYSGQFQPAKQGLIEATQMNPSEDLTNDALDMLDLIRVSESDSTGLVTFAAAMVDDRLGLSDEAEKEYLDVTKNVKTGDLVERAYWRLSEIARSAGKSDDAIGYLEATLNKYPKSLRTPDALLLMGEILINDKKDIKKGTEIYERILTDHPEALQVEEARRRLRKLGTPET
ncbi:MAG: tetratricopeptide repeat protein [bacterium]|nr:tetratricopeptide repeat protein [bacterium]